MERVLYTVASVLLGVALMSVLTPIAALDYQYRVKFLSRHEYQPQTVSNKIKLKSSVTKIEVFQVLTEDNYVLTLKHIVTTLSSSSVQKRPLLLLTNVPSMALPLVFMKTHDVWIGYGRLSNHSEHISLTTADIEYWKSFTFNDIIAIDYPKLISFIKNLTSWAGDDKIDIAAFGYNATLMSLFLKDGKSPQIKSINKIVLLDPMDSKLPVLKNVWLKIVCSFPWEILCGFENFRLHFIVLKDSIFNYIESEAKILIPIVYCYNWIQRCILVYLLHCDDYKWNNYKENDLVDSLPGLNSLKKTFEHFTSPVDISIEPTNPNFNNCLILKSKFTKDKTPNTNEKVNRILYHHFDFVYANDINSIIHKKLSTFFSH